MFDRKAPYVAIVDFGMGNLFSVKRACEHVGLEAKITHNKSEILNADGLTLPGVGAFGDAMRHLEELDLISPIKDFIQSGKPFMGICLGMQLLLSESEEFGMHKGLDVIEGRVVRFPVENSAGRTTKVPQVGWNQIFRPSDSDRNRWSQSPLGNLENGEYMYFVHSYYPVPVDAGIVLSTTVYEHITYCSSFKRGNVFATQFHPEKSAKVGIQIYKNWAKAIWE